MDLARQIPLDFEALSEDAMIKRAQAFRALMSRRRTVRDFSARPVPREIIENCIMTGASAPSGANQQPWTFVAIGNAETKRTIRIAAEEEERAFYSGRAPREWLDALSPIGTDWHKPFLETAPWLIAVFMQRWGNGPDGLKAKHYYALESVGMAAGLLVAALHNAGVATLTHTPSPMGFLNGICGRPENEKPIMLIVAGFPADGATVPAIRRKVAEDVVAWRE
jgi:iodotyrosine deiodinase